MDSNPSALSRRVLAAILACAGFGIAAYLGGYQIGWWDRVWDPFFGSASERVLRSAFSRALPVPDAWLGALAYAIEAVLELTGNANRWRERLGLTAANMIIVAAMALGSLGLVAAQALVLRALCTLCLASAACSLAIAALGWPEMRTMASALVRHVT